MKKIALFGLMLLTAACSSTLPNPYKPDNSFPKNGKGIVSIQFASEFMGEQKAVATVWNKMTEEGGLDRNMRLTYNGAEDKGPKAANHTPERVELMLEPGHYVLNKVSNGVSVGMEDEIAYITKDKKPNWLMLTVEAGKTIKYPTIEFTTVFKKSQPTKLKAVEFREADDNGKWIFGSGMEYEDGSMRTQRY